MLIDDFSAGAESRWRFISDRVMGGVSDGTTSLDTQDGITFARLRGTVSTANNGGFIQIRQDLQTSLPAQATGIALKVRGNGAAYYIHLRPAVSRRPWQYYQAAFETTVEWQEITLPWSAFKARGGLGPQFVPTDINSVGIVAYGADYEAVLDIAWIATSADK